MVTTIDFVNIPHTTDIMKTTCIILVTALATALASAEDSKARKRLDTAPAAVRQTVNDNSRGGVLDDFDVITIDGKSIYIAEIELPAELKIYVSENGSLLKTREDIPFSAAPEAVRKAVTALGGTVDETKLETSGKTSTYLIEIDRLGEPDLNVTVSPEGAVLNRHEEADD
jgi:uncharacterized membrane protein YkoI